MNYSGIGGRLANSTGKGVAQIAGEDMGDARSRGRQLKEQLMSRVDRREIDRMTDEQLRTELVWMWEQHLALIEAFRELPEIPSHTALHALSNYADHSRDHALGKQVQREAGIDAVPPNSEKETGAGLWARIRPALLKPDDQ